MKKQTSLFSMFRSASFTVGMAVCLAIYVSGCTAWQGGDNPQSQVTVEELESGRLIKHAMGETVVPKEPQRIVILTNEGTDMLLALGLKPIGAVQSWQGDPYYDYLGDQLDNVPTVGDELQPNLESIAALKPDLIIGSKVRQRGIYKKLEAIAPTVFSETLGATWKDNLELYAKAVNREAEAQLLITEWDKRIAEFKEKVASNPSTISLVRFLPGATRIYLSESFPGQLVEEAGLVRPETQQKEDFAQEIGIESIDDLNADYLFYFTFDNEEQSGSETESEWLKHPLWQNLEVVKEGRAYAVSDAEWTSSSGIISANLVLDDLSEYVLSQEESE